MDIDKIDLKALAADRIAAQKPSGIRAAHCWFCNKIEAWFQCDCPEAREAQSGKRAKPYFDAKRGTMVLDEDIIQRNLAWGHGRRYTPPVHAVDKSSVDSDAVDKAATARRAYKAEHERQRRAKQKPQP